MEPDGDDAVVCVHTFQGRFFQQDEIGNVFSYLILCETVWSLCIGTPRLISSTPEIDSVAGQPQVNAAAPTFQ
jgi:hypothetical protein